MKEVRHQQSQQFINHIFRISHPSLDAPALNINSSNDGPSAQPKRVFTCPMCRAKCDINVIDKASMNCEEFLKDLQTQCKEAVEVNEEIVIWQYSGRNGGWWAYQPMHNLIIEQKYLDFVNGSVTVGNGDDDVKAHQCMIEISIRNYICDFQELVQFDCEFPRKRRKIRRSVQLRNENSSGGLKKLDSDIKGCAGKYFKKTK